ncbi:sterol carrier family protein [Glutamicibacter sp. MNS18]|uniref:sterol carrier family protein n=1 Tax=Glutamicibacter sp. MNS18 TaxID=2989817 RepID=UPI0022358B81|nr:sterol carrier family protein [Glutamicibacter sp. MNS18]MCW4463989.1 sterol carrier family protein [Glutamicibacter sp. MNS18]
MAIKRKIDPVAGASALRQWSDEAATGTVPARQVRATAVRFALEELAERAEGNSVEVRVPPFGVTQCIAGPRHTRGTPPNVVEMPDDIFLSLVTGKISWDQAITDGALQASGLRADLSAHLPLFE